MLNDKDFADIIRLARRAPLQNMDEAEAAAKLLQRFAAFADAVLDDKVVDFPRDSQPPEGEQDSAAADT